MADQNLTSDEKLITENNYTKPPIEFDAVKRYYERHRDNTHPYIVECLKNHYMYAADRQSQLEKDKETWRTNIKAPLTHMYVSWVHNMLIDSDVRFTAIDKQWHNQAALNAILDIAEYTTQQEETSEAVESSEFDAVLLWFWYFKSSYVYSETEIQAMTKDGKMETFKDKKDYAVLRYVSPFNIFWPTYRLSTDKRIVCERRLIPSTKIEDEYRIYGMKFKKDEVTEKWSYIDNVDWESVKENVPFYNNTSGRDIFDDDTFNIKDKMLEVFEVHTDRTISIWVNSIYHGTYTSLGPLKKIKYYEILFKKIPGMKKAVGVAYIVRPMQEVYDAVLNMRIDNVKLALNKVFFMDQSANIFGNTKTMKLKPGAIFQVRDVNQVKEMDVSEVKQSAYTELDSMFQMTQWLIGVSAPWLGMQQKVERTAAGAEILKNAADNQLKPLLKSISWAMGDALKDIIILTHYYMDDDTLSSICGQEWAKAFKEVKIEDLMRDITFSYDMTSQSSETLAIKRQQLQSLLEIAARTTDFWGTPIYDIEKIAIELAKTYNLDFSATMTPERVMEVLKMANEIKQKVQSEWMQMPNPEWDQWQSPQPNPQEQVNALNQIPWAWIPAEMSPNPTWVNE